MAQPPPFDLRVSPAQFNYLLTLVKEHRASGKSGSHLESWAELESNLNAQGRAWANRQKTSQAIKRRLLK